MSAFYDRDGLIDQLSGEIAYEFFNEANNFGLHTDDGAALPETPRGGAAALGLEFAAVENKTLLLPTGNPPTVACPNHFNPALQPIGKDAGITGMNCLDRPFQIVQEGDLLLAVPPRGHR